MNILTFQDVSKTYTAKNRIPVTAVDRFNLSIKNGELLVLLGPSGCGKTTLLRMVAGLETITRGDILLGGKSIRTLRPNERPFAMVFQNHALYPHMTVEKNLTYGLRARKEESTLIEQRLVETLSLLQLGREHLPRKPAELSGGQRQRVALGKAIMQRPAVYLLDEPLSNLDQNLRIHLRRQIRDIQRRLKATMILVTHDQEEALMMGDRIALMNRGRMEQTGPPMTLFKNPRTLFAAGFMGHPAMNLIQGTLEEKGARHWFRERGDGRIVCPADGVSPAMVAGEEIILGIRPESVSMTVASNRNRNPQAHVVEQEICGITQILHARTGVHTIAGLPRNDGRALAPGTPVTLDLAPGQALFFDPATGERLAPPQSRA